MKKEFVPYEEALALKELGFDEECLAIHFYDKIDGVFFMITHLHHTNNDVTEKSCIAPLYQQAFDWFRENYDLHSVIPGFSNKFMNENDETHLKQYRYSINIFKSNSADHIRDFDSYEEARLECIRELIEIVKERKL